MGGNTLPAVRKVISFKEAYSMDFEPSLAHNLASKSTRVGPLVAAFRLVDRCNAHSWCPVHLAIDSAFAGESTFNWLQSRAAYVTCAIASGGYGPTSMLTLGLADDFWRLFYSPDLQRVVSIMRDKGIKKEASSVVTMSNAFVPVDVENPSQPLETPKVTAKQFLAIASLPPCALQLLCRLLDVTFVPSHPFRFGFSQLCVLYVLFVYSFKSFCE